MFGFKKKPVEHVHDFRFLGNALGKKKTEGSCTSWPMITFSLCKCGEFKIGCGGRRSLVITGKTGPSSQPIVDLRKYVPQCVWDNDYD